MFFVCYRIVFQLKSLLPWRYSGFVRLTHVYVAFVGESEEEEAPPPKKTLAKAAAKAPAAKAPKAAEESDDDEGLCG